MENLVISSCIKPAGFGKIKTSSIHQFLDISEGGYGQSSYLRMEDDQGKIHCVLLIGKSRVCPLKYISIPRLELIAATSSVKVSLLLRRWESPLTRNVFEQIPRLFWETTTTTAKNIRYLLQTGFNSSEKNADPKQCFYVPTKQNPVDDSSRGLKDVHSEKIKRWFEGPGSLWKSESE